jgi:hypothetical protein
VAPVPLPGFFNWRIGKGRLSDSPATIEDLAVKTLLDVPCGDWNWMSHTDLSLERYIGGDIIAALVRWNQERFSNPRRTFMLIDLCTDDLPDADLLLCRDALIHFSFKDLLDIPFFMLINLRK